MSAFVLHEVFAHVPPFGLDVVKAIIPHRPPFLLVDGITEFTEDSVSGYKVLDPTDRVFEGHFPGNPVFPGVLQIEVAAQVGACWILSRRENLGKTAYLMKVEEARYRLPVLPGQRLEVFGTISHLKARSGKLTAELSVDGKAVSSATILFAFQKDDHGRAGAQ
jgi:3-hydroxyacyl-[acyl-carrier-protein] dehydratase